MYDMQIKKKSWTNVLMRLSRNRAMGEAEANPSQGKMQGAPWAGRQSIARLTLRQTTIHTYGQFR